MPAASSPMSSRAKNTVPVWKGRPRLFTNRSSVVAKSLTTSGMMPYITADRITILAPKAMIAPLRVGLNLL